MFDRSSVKEYVSIAWTYWMRVDRFVELCNSLMEFKPLSPLFSLSSAARIG